MGRIWNLYPKQSTRKIELNFEVIKEAVLAKQAVALAIHIFGETS